MPNDIAVLHSAQDMIQRHGQQALMRVIAEIDASRAAGNIPDIIYWRHVAQAVIDLQGRLVRPRQVTA